MVSLLNAGILQFFKDFFTALFNLIPKLIYLLYASLACILDVLQMAFRKLAGLDVYFVDGKKVTGDIVSNFITGILGIRSDGVEYSVLTNVFWAFIVFGLIMLFMTTIVAIIKSHYTYDDKSAKGPMQYVYTAGKAVVNMVAVPIIVVLGLYINQAILTAVDSITSTSTSSIETLFGTESSTDGEGNTINESVASKYLYSVDTVNGGKTYIYYDMFGANCKIKYGKQFSAVEKDTWKGTDVATIGATNAPISGQLFRVAAYNANRVRLGTYSQGNFTGSRGTSFDLFKNAKDRDQLADMVDTCFANNLHTKDSITLSYDLGGTQNIVSFKYFANFLTTNISAFSKFNVGAVWYYYDLWQFNFIVGFAGVMLTAGVLVNIVFGLISRLFTCIVLFLIAPPLFGLAPLDGGDAGKKWRSNFMKNVLMTYGAVVGMNLMFLILPYINTIDFFNIKLIDIIMQTLILIAGLITVKAMIGLFSDLIGGADSNKTGKDLATETGTAAFKGGKMALGAGKLALKAPAVAVKAGQAAYGGIRTGVAGVQTGVDFLKNRSAQKDQKTLDKLNDRRTLANKLTGVKGLNEKGVKKYARDAGLSRKEAKLMSKAFMEEQADAKKTGRNLDAGNILNNVNSSKAGKNLVNKADKVTTKYAKIETNQKAKMNKYLDEDLQYKKFSQMSDSEKASAKANLNQGIIKQRIDRTSDSMTYHAGQAKAYGKMTGSKFSSAVQDVTKGSMGLAGDTYGGLPFVKDVKEEVKKGSDKKKEDVAKKSQADYQKAVTDSLSSLNEKMDNVNKSGDKK